MRKRLLALLLVIVMVVNTGFIGNASMVNEYSNESTHDNRLLDILNDFHSKIQKVSLEKISTPTRNVDTLSSAKRLIVQNTVDTLREAGYDAYNLNTSNYYEMEIELKTDFDEIGLSPNGSYVVILGDGNSNDMSKVGTAGPQFTHTYNGKTYTMRTLTITAADDNSMSKVDDASIINNTSASQTIIQNFLDTVISALVSEISVVAGTAASILGLSVGNFKPNKTAQFTLNAGANWTRVYTQVYDTYDGLWAYGSCVEYCSTLHFITGMYYSASANAYQSVKTGDRTGTKYSSYYNNTTWRRDTAAHSFFYGNTTYDSVGDAKFKFGNSVKLTFREDF